MANIAENLRKILASRFGKDVRQAIHDSISDINEIAEGQEQLINSHIQDAEAWAKGTKNGEVVESTDPAYHNNSKYYSEQADTDRLTSEAFAKGTHDGTAVESGTEGYHDNAKYYKEQAETAEDNAEHWYQETLALSQTLANAIIARGTVAFADLPDVTSSAVKNGFMWNISDNFTTTSDFVEGAGVNIPMGANVYKVTINNTPMWDILAGSSAAVFVGTEAQIAQADAQGLISENTMIISLDGEAPYELTSSMILHGNDSVENVLDGLSNDVDKINISTADYVTTDSIGNALKALCDSFTDDGTYSGRFKATTNPAKWFSFVLSKFDGVSSGYIVCITDASEKYTFSYRNNSVTLDELVSKSDITPIEQTVKNYTGSLGQDLVWYIKIGKIVIVKYQVYESFTANVWKEIALQTGLPKGGASAGFGSCVSTNADAYGNVQSYTNSSNYFTLRFNMSKTGTYGVRGEFIYTTTE